jgi:hypothetical protein
MEVLHAAATMDDGRVAGQFDGVACVFCSAPSSKNGEHVLPSWLLDMFSAEDGPYTTWKGEDPIRRRDDEIRTHTSMPRAKLPMCVAHNAELARRFEGPAKPIVRHIFRTEGRMPVSSPDAAVLGLWLLKTWLLLAHPSARYSDGIEPLRWDGADLSLWNWMAVGEEPPQGFSLWVSRRADSEGDAEHPRVIRLPTIVLADREIVFRVKEAGIRWLNAALVFHSGWEISYPPETEHRALRLWPPGAAAGDADLSKLPAVLAHDTVWRAGPRLYFARGKYERGHLPPIDPSFDMADQDRMIALGVTGGSE